MHAYDSLPEDLRTRQPASPSCPFVPFVDNVPLALHY